MTAVSPRHRRPGPSGWLVFLVAFGLAGAQAQDSPPTAFDRWSKLEASDELRAYRNALRDGTFDDSARNFLTKIALPQLGLAGNRPDIDRVRRKMVDRLCAVDAGADSKAAPLQGAMQTVMDFMVGVARDRKADLVHRVNATLLVGELRVPGNKPWAPAATPLAALLGDDALAPAVRIAAAAGLGRLVDADPAGRAADVGPVLAAVSAANLAGMDPVAADWLRSRALGMLAKMGEAAPDGAVAAADKILRDANRSVDVRVRAAAVAGRCRKAADAADVSATVTAIRELAVASLEAAKARSARLELAAKLAGGGRLPPPPVDLEAAPADVIPQVYRRESWRLATLADALATADGAGLAAVAGSAAGTVGELAASLREAADRLDAEPEPASLDAALEGLAAVAAGAPAPAAEPEGAAAPPFGTR